MATKTFELLDTTSGKKSTLPVRSGTVGPDVIEAAADRVGLAGRAADAECRALAERVEAIEEWQTAHAHQHELAAAVEKAREEGARAEREHTNPGRRR